MCDNHSEERFRERNLAIFEELLNSAEPTGARGLCWEAQHFQNLSQSKYGETLSTGFGMPSASRGTSQSHGNDAGRNNAIHRDNPFGSERLPVLQRGRTTIVEHHSNALDNRVTGSHLTGELATT